jgi:hypothetical protein
VPISGSQSGLVKHGSVLIEADFFPRITRMNTDAEQFICVIRGKNNFPYPPIRVHSRLKTVLQRSLAHLAGTGDEPFVAAYEA